MKRKQTRYTSEAQILEAIDAAKSKLEELRNEAIVIKEWIRLNRGEVGHLLGKDDELRKIEDKVRRIEDVRLPKLKNALAEFRTEVMPFTQDRGVVLK